MLDRMEQRQLQGLVQAFHRRQRQASLLVACSVAAAFLLTFGGLVLLFSVTDPGPAGREDAQPQDGTSVGRTARKAEIARPLLEAVHVRTNRSAKAAPLLIRAKAGADTRDLDQAISGMSVILTTPKRPLALAPLLPVGSAHYLLLRGLPKEAELSAGRRTGTGTWMVKGDDVANLTLTLDGGANGDYPLEVYLLDASSGPQARRRLILRVDQKPQVYAAGFGLSWPMPPSGTNFEAVAPLAKPVSDAPPIEAEALRVQAQTLFGEGDIAGARILLTRLAERGDKDAAYELALTYDWEVLAKAGVQGIAGDEAIARAWYEEAAREGHAGAAERLQRLARPRGGA